MAKVQVEVLDAVVDGKKKGETLSVEEASAKQLIELGYVKESKVAEKPVAKPKPRAKAKAADEKDSEGDNENK